MAASLLAPAKSIYYFPLSLKKPPERRRSYYAKRAISFLRLMDSINSCMFCTRVRLILNFKNALLCSSSEGDKNILLSLFIQVTFLYFSLLFQLQNH